jgi:quercetin dioxygenase-like cupin family protein
VRRWDLAGVETPGGSVSPVVLHSNGEGRAVLIGLDPGQELGEHQVREHEFILVLDGTVRVQPDEEGAEAGPGTLFLFEPAERRTVSSESGARLLLLLAPWPAEGHYPQ